MADQMQIRRFCVRWHTADPLRQYPLASCYSVGYSVAHRTAGRSVSDAGSWSVFIGTGQHEVVSTEVDATDDPLSDANAAD
jgi:hypothetical protein